jgi:peptidoglycan/xylan/chitin deacetylase (PgdA/CDA1 family)
MNVWSILGPAAGVAAGVGLWGAVSPTAELFGPTVHRTPRRSTVALTFDDGPNPALTPQLLALLERHGIRATFFLVGRWARACPGLVREIAAQGHEIGNHTETHPNLVLLSASRIEHELELCQESIATALGASSETPHAAHGAWLRPPFGFRGPRVAGAVERARLRGVAMWSLTCYDWKPQRPAALIERLGRVMGKGAYTPTAGRRGGEIVLLHDGDFQALGADRQHVLVALKYWLPRWRDAGLKFATISEVAAAPPDAA